MYFSFSAWVATCPTFSVLSVHNDCCCPFVFSLNNDDDELAAPPPFPFEYAVQHVLSASALRWLCVFFGTPRFFRGYICNFSLSINSRWLNQLMVCIFIVFNTDCLVLLFTLSRLHIRSSCFLTDEVYGVECCSAGQKKAPSFYRTRKLGS
jgi:hypothetical protein